MDIYSFLFGVAVPPAMAATWYLAWRLKNWCMNRIEWSEPENPARRAYLAARVFAGRRVFITRLPRATLAITLGLHHSHQQRASHALLDEFAPHPSARRNADTSW